jgi:hypothetical protein
LQKRSYVTGVRHCGLKKNNEEDSVLSRTMFHKGENKTLAKA